MIARWDQPVLPSALAKAERVLVAGAGDDVYAGLPLYFALRRAGEQALLANLTHLRSALRGTGR